jgi:Protein of unknown function (DUF2934)
MPCVYTTPAGLCDGTALLSANEHYLPRALGNFQGDERLVNRICNHCQGVFSQLEDVFAHNSPEAFFREMVGHVGRKNHKGKNIFYEPTFGIPPLAILGKQPGHDFEILWELVPDPENAGNRRCIPVSQLVFISDDNKTLRLPFRPGRWTAERIKAILEKSGVKGDQIVAVGNTEAERAEMTALIDVLAVAGKERQVAPMVDGADIEGEMEAEMSEEYLRAIAKVGFHFFLNYFPNFSGMEPEFDDIKRFIYLGEADRELVRIVDEPFLRNLKQGARLKKWSHLLSVESSDGGIEARMQFFVGPEVQPFVWSVVISTQPSERAKYTGYAFVYFDDVYEEYQGQRKDLIAELTSVEEDIRLRAYSLYVQRGRRNGFALNDWLEAEAEILGMLRQGAVTLKPLS